MRYAVAVAIMACFWLMGMTAVAFFILVVVLPTLFLTRMLRPQSGGSWKRHLRHSAALLGAILAYLAVKDGNVGFLVTLAVMVPVFMLVERVWWHEQGVFLMPPNGYHHVDPESPPENLRALLLAHGCELPAGVGHGEGVVFDASKRVKGRGTIIQGLLFFAVSKRGLSRCIALVVEPSRRQPKEIA